MSLLTSPFYSNPTVTQRKIRGHNKPIRNDKKVSHWVFFPALLAQVLCKALTTEKKKNFILTSCWLKCQIINFNDNFKKLWSVRMWKYAFSHGHSTSINVRIIWSQMDYSIPIPWQPHGKCIYACPIVVMPEREKQGLLICYSPVCTDMWPHFSLFPLNETVHLLLGAISFFFWLSSKTVHVQSPNTHFGKAKAKKQKNRDKNRERISQVRRPLLT